MNIDEDQIIGYNKEMQAQHRSLIANIAHRIISGDNRLSIYSFEDKGYHEFTGFADTQGIFVRDHTRGVNIVGNCLINLNPNMPNNVLKRFVRFSVYDYGTSSYLTLEVSLNNFSGYDYQTKTYYGGIINGNYISLYDYQTKRYYKYMATLYNQSGKQGQSQISKPEPRVAKVTSVAPTPSKKKYAFYQPVRQKPIPAEPPPQQEDVVIDFADSIKKHKQAIKQIKRELKLKRKQESKEKTTEATQAEKPAKETLTQTKITKTTRTITTTTTSTKKRDTPPKPSTKTNDAIEIETQPFEDDNYSDII